MHLSLAASLSLVFAYRFISVKRTVFFSFVLLVGGANHEWLKIVARPASSSSDEYRGRSSDGVRARVCVGMRKSDETKCKQESMVLMAGGRRK